MDNRTETVAIACTCSDGSPTIAMFETVVTQNQYDDQIEYAADVLKLHTKNLEEEQS